MADVSVFGKLRIRWRLQRYWCDEIVPSSNSEHLLGRLLVVIRSGYMLAMLGMRWGESSDFVWSDGKL